jgi:hypothetical protein
MRRAPVLIIAALLAALALPSLASAAPVVKFKAEAVPIPGFPHTGNIIGAGADLKANFEISGTEYFGSPPPPIGINFYFPQGSVINESSAFATCPEETIVKTGPSACPKNSSAGTGSADGYVTFGGERVEEELEITSFFKPGGGIDFFGFGHTPAVIEVLSKGEYTNLGGGGGYGPIAKVKIPEVASVPGAPYASVKTITGKFGAAVKKHGKTIYYGRLPKTCPKGGFFHLKTEVIFAEAGEESKPEPVLSEYNAPAPASCKHK